MEEKDKVVAEAGAYMNAERSKDLKYRVKDSKGHMYLESPLMIQSRKKAR